MNETHIVQATEIYRQKYLPSATTPTHDADNMVYRLVKGWLQYLPKEERIIFYERYIQKQSLQQITCNLEKRWTLETARTEHDVELRLSWAVQRILSLMGEQFPDFHYDFVRS